MYMDAPMSMSASLMEPDYMGSFLALMSRPDVGEIDGAGFHGVISCLDVTTIYNAARGGMKSRRCRCLTIPNHKFERAWRVRVGRSLDGRCNLLGVSKEHGRLRHYALDETQVTSIGPVRSGEAVRTGSRERKISRKKPSMWHAS